MSHRLFSTLNCCLLWDDEALGDVKVGGKLTGHCQAFQDSTPNGVDSTVPTNHCWFKSNVCSELLM